MKILLINPNTSAFVTERAVDAARIIASKTTVVEGVTGEFGAPIINSETDIIVGSHSAVDLAAKHGNDFDAIVLAVSFDTGLSALREMLSIPVVGMAEASIRRALELGDRFALISFGKRTRPLYERLALRYAGAESLAGVQCIDALTPEQMQDQNFLKSRIAEEVNDVAHKFECDVVILLATAFAGLGGEVAANIPVVDGIAAAIEMVEAAAKNSALSRLLTDSAWPEQKTMLGVSAELAHLYQQFPLNQD